MIHRRSKWLALGCVLGLLAAVQAPPVPAQPVPAQKVMPGAEKGLPSADRLLKRFGTTQFRHGSRILSLAYAPSGQLLAAGGGSDPVRLWGTETGQQKFQLNEPWVTAMVFSPRGSLLVTAGASKTLRLWEVANGKEIAKLEGHATPIKALAISPDGTMLASAGQDGL